MWYVLGCVARIGNDSFSWSRNGAFNTQKEISNQLALLKRAGHRGRQTDASCHLEIHQSTSSLGPGYTVARRIDNPACRNVDFGPDNTCRALEQIRRCFQRDRVEKAVRHLVVDDGGVYREHHSTIGTSLDAVLAALTETRCDSETCHHRQNISDPNCSCLVC
mmetsp:Transcript_27155/g.43628  ORF Transcript_27155/g.43628 Transcript_27155/m.43628 type:complete len:163 (+) Transcript_27155:1412-1900(+)